MSVTIITRTPAPARRPLAFWAAWGLGSLAVVMIGSWWVASADLAGPMCLMRRVAHLACPTCGMTRALALMARGEWRESLAAHPWGAAIVMQSAAAWMVWTRWLAMGGPRPDRWIPRVVGINGVALIAIWLIRLGTGTLPR